MSKRVVGNDVSRPLKQQKMSRPLLLTDLPEQILFRIASFLDQQDAYNLLLTNKTFNRPCKKRLYQRIVICEKYQDTFFYQLSKHQHFTILSSWPNILRFLKAIYMSVQNNQQLDTVQYVEELTSFNYLDCGKLDSHRFLSQADLRNLLSFTQCWEVAIDTFINLKSFNFIKLPLDRVYALTDEIKSNLVQLSIDMDVQLLSDGFQPEKLRLPNLKKLRLNLENQYDNLTKLDSHSASVAVDVLVTILQGKDGSRNNSTLEEFEINGYYGRNDRELEHSLRHHDWLGDVNLKSSFMLGFEVAEAHYANKVPIGKLGRRETSEALVTESDDDDIDDESFDAVYYDVENEESDYNGSDHDPDEEEDPQVTEEVNRILGNVKFSENKSGFFNKLPDKLSVFDILISKLAREGITLNNLKIFTLSNVVLDPYDFFELKVSLQELIPNLQDLQELHLRNVHSRSITRIPVLDRLNESVRNSSSDRLLDERMPVLDYSMICISALFTDTEFYKLTRLSIFSNPDLIGDFDAAVSHEKDLQLKELSNFRSILDQSPNIKILKYSASHKIKFREFLSTLINVRQNGGLKHLTQIIYTRPSAIIPVCRKLLNIKVFKRFKKFTNLRMIDDYYFGISKQLIEFFNTVARIDSYGNDETDLEYLIQDKRFLFNDEFQYLFKNDVKRFFIHIESLEKFIYFGYTFHRKDMNL